MSEFRNVKPVGRVTAEFNLSKLIKKPSLDTTLHHGDKIHIPAFAQEIYVLGEVLTPGARLYDPSSKARIILVNLAGLAFMETRKES